jgi:hypothetical protein
VRAAVLSMALTAGRSATVRGRGDTRRVDWETKLAEAERAHDERASSPPEGSERLDLHLAAVGSASWAAGLALAMLGRREDSAAMLRRAADEYRSSWDVAPAESWGRPLAVLRCALMAGDQAGAEAAAIRAFDEGAAGAASSIARYAAVLALLTVGQDGEAARLAQGLRGLDDFPAPVAEALAGIAGRDLEAYELALRDVLRSFEERDAFLEDTPVADTVLVLAALARARGLEARLSSPLLPP